MQKQVAIIGGGPAGLSAAYALIQRGWTPTVFESSRYLGGMSRSFELWGHPVDFGPHRFFTKSPQVSALWSKILGNDIVKINRKTRIYFNGKFIDYPLALSNVCKNLGFIESAFCVLSYLTRNRSKFECKRNPNLEDWLIYNFGTRLYRHFFKDYNKKLWGVCCDRIAADFAAQRIRGLSLPEAIKSAIGKKTRSSRTLSDSFEYPSAGAGMLYQKMGSIIKETGGVIHLESRINKIKSTTKEQIKITTDDGKEWEFDNLISTMPLTNLVFSLDDAPPEVITAASGLQYRNTIIVYLKVEADLTFNDQWIYVHDAKVKCGRITNFRNWLSNQYEEGEGTILCCEYWCSDNDELWKGENDKIIRIASEDIRQAGLIGRAKINKSHVERVHRSYPMYLEGYKDKISIISKWLNRINGITAIGRSGSHMYNNQDHSILMGILAAENICDNARHNLWDFNRKEEYQES